MVYPKILIFGQPFNNFSGGGITLSNLFKGWPKEKIAVAYIGHGLLNVTTDICDTYYQLGKEEHKWIFPFNLIQRKFTSGLKSYEGAKKVPLNYIQTRPRYKIVNNLFFPILEWFGLFHMMSKIHLSSRLKSWLSDYSPNILYLQVSTREEIIFSEELLNYMKIPSVVHMMDDWPTTISNKGLFKRYWFKKIDSEFRILLKKADVCLSISDAMSDEYRKRYDRAFTAFHNPIETDSWLKYSKKSYGLNNGYITILYSGRIGIGIKDSLIEAAKAIDGLVKKGHNIKLHIQTPLTNESLLRQMLGFECVVINPFASYEELPKLFSDADILLLANDFSDEGAEFLRYSMPTKASEYMISGTPILVYAPENAAVSAFFKMNKCGYCITRQDISEISDGILYMINNEGYRSQIGQNARTLAEARFSADIVRKEFQGLLVEAKTN